jgi:hypothetical protein
VVGVQPPASQLYLADSENLKPPREAAD